MDLTQITDLTQLKAVAYDQIGLKEQAERNLQAVNQRIAQVSQNQIEAEAQEGSAKGYDDNGTPADTPKT